MPVTRLNAKLPAEISFIERGWLNANNVLIHASGAPAIVDTGHLACVDETVSLIRAAGIEPARIGQIVITHSHSDHHGGNRRLQTISGAPIAMGAKTADWFARNERHLTWFNQLSQEVDVVPANEIYHAGDQVVLGGMPFEVIALPGHAPDGIGYFQPDTRVMICADALWLNDTGMLHPQVHGWDVIADAELALQRLQALDITVAIPGHGGLISNVADSAERALRRLESFRRDPAKLAWHTIRRFTVYGVLRYQPIAAIEYTKQVQDDSWIGYYCDVINDSASTKSRYSASHLLDVVLDDLKARDIVQENDGYLSCDMRR